MKMNDNSAMWALGFMSGTSCDGVDAAMIYSDGHDIFEFGHTAFRPFNASDRAFLLELNNSLAQQGAILGYEEKIAAASCLITNYHIELTREILSQIPKDKWPQIIGFHGQTLFHAPDKGVTLQVGYGSRLAQQTKIDVIDQFRLNDVYNGGQGAPLAPIYHDALARMRFKGKISAFINIGGIANISLCQPNEPPIAFDTGPGNALMDQLMQKHQDKPYDTNGAFAREGKIIEHMLNSWLKDPYFTLPYPKSADRAQFNHCLNPTDISFQDHMRSLLEFTVKTIYDGLKQLDRPIDSLIVSGGGSKNSFLMDELEERLQCPILKADDIGLRSDYIEAEAFAYLAIRHLKQLPLSFPTTTNVSEPLLGGKRHKA